MSVEMKSGTISDFFASAKATAKEIDEAKKITTKNIIWIEPEDMINLLKPERARLVRYLRGKKRIVFSELVKVMHRNSMRLNRDISLLLKYNIVRIKMEKNPGHGLRKVIEPMFGTQRLEFKVEV